MRSFLLALFVSFLGGGLGYWRATSEWNQHGDLVGDGIDLAAVRQAINSYGKEEKDVDDKSGTVSANSIPRVEVVGGTHFDFGTMKHGSERTHAFRLRNKGNAPLKLKVIGSTCKCTIGSLEKTDLPPGEETLVNLTWKAEGYLDDFAQTATIGTNDPGQLEVLLSISGKIGQSYVLDPNELSFGEFSSAETFEKKFKLYSYEDVPLTVVGYWANLEQTQITVEHAIRRLASNEVPAHADARYVADFTVKVASGLPAGPLAGQVHIEVGPDKTPLSVLCNGRCVSDLRVIAGQNYNEELNVLQMGRIQQAEGGQANFHISARNPENRQVELKLKKILPESLKDRFDVSIGEPIVKSGRTLFPVSINVPKNTPPFDRSGNNPSNYIKLYFESNLDGSREITLNLRVHVLE